jgi:hypothetical protein
MTIERALPAELIAGVLSGIVGLMVFLTIHHFWIKPIWFILPPGLFIAALGGLAVGWSYAEIRVGLPPRPWTFLALSGLIGLTLLPAILIAQTRPSLVDITTGVIPPGDGGRIATHFVVEMLVPAAIIGGLAGWLIGRTPNAAIATAIAGLVFALGPGHNIPFLGSTPATGKGLVLMAVIILSSALVLVEVSTWLARR